MWFEFKGKPIGNIEAIPYINLQDIESQDGSCTDHIQVWTHEHTKTEKKEEYCLTKL